MHATRVKAGGVLDPSKQQLNLAAGGPAAAGMAKALQLSGGTMKKGNGNNKGKRDEKGPAKAGHLDDLSAEFKQCLL